MKNHTITLIAGSVLAIISLSSTVLFNQEKNLSLAEVPRQNGKYIFFRSEPANDYEVVTEIKPAALQIGEVTIQDGIDGLLKRASRSKKEYDAIITEDGVRGVAIKFK